MKRIHVDGTYDTLVQVVRRRRDDDGQFMDEIYGRRFGRVCAFVEMPVEEFDIRLFLATDGTKTQK